MRLIINADDCGRTKAVDKAIEDCINKGLISSTTIMANMDDFEGAIELYRKYKDKIGFGLHVNLTEGEPLLKSQILLDEGFLQDNHRTVVFAGTNNAYCKLSKEGKREVYKEMEAQLDRLLSYGITPTHIDSHQYIHFSRNILPLFLKLGREHGIKRMRRNDNTEPFFSIPHEIFKRIWKVACYMLNPGCKSTDFFCPVSKFVELYNKGQVKTNRTYELMCHPGHEDILYRKDSLLLVQEPMKTILSNCTLTNYSQI